MSPHDEFQIHKTGSVNNVCVTEMESRTFENPVRIGMLTPSSNSVLEPVTHEMIRDLNNISVHFSRLRVTEIALDETALAQFDLKPFLQATSLLTDARCKVIAWSGTSGGWRGFDHDRAICETIESASGARATTSVLALQDLFEEHGIGEFGLLTPYTADIQEKIIQNFGDHGFQCIAERHLNIRDNFSFAGVDTKTLDRLCRELSAEGARSIAIICTNIKGAGLAQALEAELGITLYDSVAAVVFRALQLADIEPGQIQGWGRIFESSR